MSFYDIEYKKAGKYIIVIYMILKLKKEKQIIECLKKRQFDTATFLGPDLYTCLYCLCTT